MTGDLVNLKRETRNSFNNAYAVGTRKNLKTQWKAFFLFCNFYELVALPCSLETLCLYCQFLSRSFKSTESIKNYVNGIKCLHLMLDLDFNHLDTFYFKLFFKGLKRINPHEVRSALPISPTILLKFREILDFNDRNHVTFWCLFLFAFFLMCRKSNLVGTPDEPEKCLNRSDVIVGSQFLLVNFRWSKTIQFGERSLQIPLVKNRHSFLCPFSAYISMCNQFSVPDTSPAFVVSKKGILTPVTYNMFNSFLKDCIIKIGLDPNKFSTHSFRRGGATWAFKCGVPSDLIQLQGDWKSSAYKLYLRYGLNEKLSVANKMTSGC